MNQFADTRRGFSMATRCKQRSFFAPVFCAEVMESRRVGGFLAAGACGAGQQALLQRRRRAAWPRAVAIADDIIRTINRGTITMSFAESLEPRRLLSGLT